MRVRYYGLVFLALVVAVPIGVLSFLTTDRAEETAVFELRNGNDRLARAVARQITDYVAAERELIASFGEVVTQAPDRLLQLKLTHAFLIKHRHVKSVAVYDPSGKLIVGDDGLTVGLAQALAGQPARTSVPQSEAGRAIGHMILVAEPIIVAGKQRGAALAKVDLVGIWEPVEAVKIGKSGFVRLLTTDGVLLAHGNPEERRFVFNPEADVSARLVAGALANTLVRNKQGEEVIATAALIPQIEAIVLVEQPAAEAYAAVSSMKSQLVAIAASTLFLALILGFVFGDQIVRGLERLRRHTRVLARGDLGRTLDPRAISKVKEIRGLADAVNDMAGELDVLQREMQERERIDTFARVAAGLAHDLRHPVDAIRGACIELSERPEDPMSVEHVISVSQKHVPRLSRFMDDLTRLARTGELELEVEEHDPLALAREVASEIAASPKFAGMVSFEARGDHGTFRVDPQLIKRALYNLANNGAEACMERGPGGSVTIDVSFEEDSVRLAVTDTGSGIEPERIAEVLSSNFKSTKRSTGVGLGLGVVRQVAESHRGTLDLDSEVGRGSTFTLALPGSTTVERHSNEGELNEPVEAQAV